jgi:plasmid rolling circle replication initiator protein Rep
MRKKVENSDILNDDFKLNSSTDLSAKNTLLKRARAKYFTLGLIFGLVDLDSLLKKSYWNTFHCAEELVQDGSKITSRYCKNRWCLVCNRIRTAISILKYSDEIKSWDKDSFFVTLTIPNVPAALLGETIGKMLRDFSNIVRVIRTRRKLDFIGIRKLECTYNPNENTYHPHYHCIINGKKVADRLKKEWLKRYPLAEEFLQDIREADGNSLMEFFKYFTKVISTKSRKNNKNGLNAPVEYRRKIYIHALDVIFIAMHNRRTYQNYGFKAKNIDEDSEGVIELAENNNEISYFKWEKELHDWLNIASGEILTGFEPSEAVKQLLDDIKQDCNGTVPVLQQDYNGIATGL